MRDEPRTKKKVQFFPGDVVEVVSSTSMRLLSYTDWMGGGPRRTMGRVILDVGYVALVVSVNTLPVGEQDGMTVFDNEVSFLHPEHGILWWWDDDKGIRKMNAVVT